MPNFDTDDDLLNSNLYKGQPQTFDCFTDDEISVLGKLNAKSMEPHMLAQPH